MEEYRTILVSDGGGKMSPEPEPKSDWARHALRVNEVIDNQVRSLRKRQVIGSFQADERKGTYWGIRSHIGAFDPLAVGPLDALGCRLLTPIIVVPPGAGCQLRSLGS